MGEDRRRATDSVLEAIAVIDEHVVGMTAEVAMLRYEVQREREKRKRRDFIIAALFVLGLMVAGVVYQNRQTIIILKSVTSPEAQARQREATRLLVCDLKNDTRSVLGAEPAPGCPPPTTVP